MIGHDKGSRGLRYASRRSDGLRDHKKRERCTFRVTRRVGLKHVEDEVRLRISPSNYRYLRRNILHGKRVSRDEKFRRLEIRYSDNCVYTYVRLYVYAIYIT